MDGKHLHNKVLIHPQTKEPVCWCKYPFCTEIRKLKELERERVLIEIYELIGEDKMKRKPKPGKPIEEYLKVGGQG